jgi:hypothetical protein
VTIHCRIPQKYLGRIQDPDTTIIPHADARLGSLDAPMSDPAMEDVA